MTPKSSDSADPPTSPSGRKSSDGKKPIILIDHTKPEEPADDEPRESTDDDIEPTSSKTDEPLSPKRTKGTLREELARRKYRRYQEDRLVPKGHTESNSVDSEGEVQPVEQDAAEASSRWGESKLQRGRRKAREAKDAVTGKKGVVKAKTDDDNVVDILYENQRGTFFCGIPLFSDRSLLNFDPPPWVDARFKPSAVDITNAQVPDPSWKWKWRTWYVDMSHDVDEEGWEYSFWFQKGFSWHGTHPWFHSFVRRRRWLRKRTRRKDHIAQEKAHAMNPDYFTIHSTRAKSAASSITTSEKRASSKPPSSGWGAKSWIGLENDVEIRDIPALMKALRKAAVDREKIVYIKIFLDQGGDELFYLAEQMPHIMSLLVFQNSRRQLLSILMQKFDAVARHREEHEERGQAEDDAEKLYMDSLLNAVDAADEQCKQLEFWSDVQDVARKGEVFAATEHEHGWGHEWAGVDTSGPGPDAAASEDEKAPIREEKGKGKALEASHTGDLDESMPTAEEKGKGKALVSSREGSVKDKPPGSWIDGTSEQQPKKDMEAIMSDDEEAPGRLSEDEGEEEPPEEEPKDEEAERVKSVEEIRDEVMPEEARKHEGEKTPSSQPVPTAGKAEAEQKEDKCVEDVLD